MKKDVKILVTIANFGMGQLEYLRRQVASFLDMSYSVTIIIHTNVHTGIVDPRVKEEMHTAPPRGDWNNLPWSCRQSIFSRKQDYDVFIYTDNDHLYKEHHVDLFLESLHVLPDDRILGFMQYEEYPELKRGRFYPAWHASYGWSSEVEVYKGSRFGQFTNPHHGGFMLHKIHLARLGACRYFTLASDVNIKRFNTKVRAASDVYLMGVFKKVIWLDRFEDSLLHHMPNRYLNLENGRFAWSTNQNFDVNSMQPALSKLLPQYSVIIPTMWRAPSLLRVMVEKYCLSPYVDEVLIIDNDGDARIDLTFDKVRLLGSGKNMYVNPAWNLGVAEASCENIIIANDDILIEDVDTVLSGVGRVLEEGMVVGPAESCFPQRNKKVPSQFQVSRKDKKWTYGFGTFMIMKKRSYIRVPDEILVWCGDALQHRKNCSYEFSGVLVHTKMQSTSSTLPLQHVRKSDAINYRKYR